MTSPERPEAELRPGKDALVQPVANTFFIGLGNEGCETIMLIKHPHDYWEPIGGKGKENELPEENALGEAREELANFPQYITSGAFIPLNRWLIERTGKVTLDVSRYVSLSPFLTEEPRLSSDADCTEIGYVTARDYAAILENTHSMKMRSQVRTDIAKLFQHEQEFGTTLAACHGSDIAVKVLYLNKHGNAVYLKKHHSGSLESPRYALPVYKHSAIHHLHHTLNMAASDFLKRTVYPDELKQRKVLLAQAASSSSTKPMWVLFYLVYNSEIAETYGQMPTDGAWIDLEARPTLLEKLVLEKYREEVSTVLREVHVAKRTERRRTTLELLQPITRTAAQNVSIVMDMSTFKK